MDKNILFLQNFYGLLNSGYSVEESLSLCDMILKSSMITDMQKKLMSGENIETLILEQSFPRVFKEYFSFYCHKNCLSDAIEKSLHIYMTQETYQKKLKSQLTYPLVLLTFLFFFSLFVVFILLPNVNQLFESFQIEKSWMIQGLFSFFYVFPLLFIIIFLLFVGSLIHLFRGLKYKRFKTIEFYLKIYGVKEFLQKYFSLKFVIYYYELTLENIDSASIIHILNKQMVDSDIKIVLYELDNRIMEGESIEEALENFEYFDQLFLTFFRMYIQNPQQQQSLQHYIDLTYQQFDSWIHRFIKYLIPCIYGFVAFFVITIYVSIIIPMMNVISEV